jgi:hypothetical protein
MKDDDLDDDAPLSDEDLATLLRSVTRHSTEASQSGLEEGPVRGSPSTPVPATLHGGELVINKDQQALMAAGLKRGGAGQGEGDEVPIVNELTIVLSRDLQQALRTSPKEIEAVVDSSILRNGSVRRTIRSSATRR